MISLPMHSAIVFQCVWQGGYVTGRMSLGMGPVSSLACVSLFGWRPQVFPYAAGTSLQHQQ